MSDLWKWWVNHFKEDPLSTTIGTLLIIWIAVSGLTCIAKEAVTNWYAP
jgi:hypothetical protein